MASVALDLRSNTKAGIANDPTPGMGLFIDQGKLWCGPWQWRLDEGGFWGAPTLIDPLQYVDLGSDPLARMRQAARDGLADKLGLDRRLLPDTNLADLLAHFILGTLADPTGQDRAKPLRMGSRGLRLRLGEFGEVLREDFSRNHPNFDATLAVRLADYRRNKGSNVPLEILQCWTGHDMQALYGRMGDDLLDKLVPGEFIEDGWREPRTTIGDTFTDTNGVDLTAHTATGPNGGFAWSVTQGAGGNEAEIQGNELVLTSGASRVHVRADSNLSSDAHSAQVTKTADGSTSHQGGPITRFPASADTGYVVIHKRQTTVNRLFKNVAGTLTELASNDDAAPTLPYDIKLSSDDSDEHTVSIDGVTKITHTNGDITGNLRTGISNGGGSGATVTVDDFEAADLEAAGGGAGADGPFALAVYKSAGMFR